MEESHEVEVVGEDEGVPMFGDLLDAGIGQAKPTEGEEIGDFGAVRIAFGKDGNHRPERGEEVSALIVVGGIDGEITHLAQDSRCGDQPIEARDEPAQRSEIVRGVLAESPPRPDPGRVMLSGNQHEEEVGVEQKPALPETRHQSRRILIVHRRDAAARICISLKRPVCPFRTIT